mgnify:CR=1 FL=1
MPGPAPGSPSGGGELKITIFGREPAAWLYALQALLAFAVTVPALGITEEMSAWIMTIANGLMAALVAVLTRPFVVSALTGAVQTVLTGMIAFGLPMTEQQTGAAVAALSVILGLILRPNVSPAEGGGQ